MNSESLKSLAGRVVRIERSGPESRLGKLVAIKDDHIVIYHEDEGMIYFNNDHIKSLSMDTRDFSDLVLVLSAETTDIPDHIDASSFTSVMSNMMYRWVQINRGGPEKLEGVLIGVSDESITLVAKDEIVNIVPYHVRSVSYGMKKQENKEKENNNDKQDNNKQANKNQQEG